MSSLKDKLSTGVYWGRFNPPHRGHLSVVRRLTRNWNLIVAIGSSEHRNERTNPFSGAERKRMMESYLKEAGIRGVRVVSLRDGRSKEWAVDNLIWKCKPAVIFLSNELRELAQLARKKVRVVGFRRTGTISSTRIRDSIASGDRRWTELTGQSVVRTVVQIDGIRRIRRAYSKKDAK